MEILPQPCRFPMPDKRISRKTGLCHFAAGKGGRKLLQVYYAVGMLVVFR